MKLTALEQFRHRMVRENRIYIMPSGRGMTFLAVIIVLVLTGATYNNNLVFLLAFFLFSLFIASMIQTHYNLKGVRLHYLSCEDGFAGEPMALLFHLEQKRARFKHSIEIRPLNKRWKPAAPARESMAPIEARKPVRVLLVAPERGLHQLPMFALETYFPLGLFRAWKVFRPQGEVIVYPRPQGERELPASRFEFGEHDLGLRNSPEGDFGELKDYQTGESYHQVAWKHFARTGMLYTKVHWGEEHRHFHLPWSPQSQKFENYLQQMSAWIKAALEENATFAMDLPIAQIPSGSGPEHARLCWRALAALKEAA